MSPDILGVSTGAGLGAVTGILLGLPVALIQLLGFGGGLLTVMLVATLAHAVSEAAAYDAVHDAKLDAEIQRLNDLLAAGGDPVALQTVVDSLVALSAQGVAQGVAIDDATTALAAAFPTPPPAP